MSNHTALSAIERDIEEQRAIGSLLVECYQNLGNNGELKDLHDRIGKALGRIGRDVAEREAMLRNVKAQLRLRKDQ